MTTAERMRARRKELGMSAEYIAEKLGYSPATVYRWERGDIEKMPIDVISPLATLLQTTPAYLMGLGWDGDRLRDLRIKSGISLTEVSKATGIPESSLDVYERGIVEPTVSDLEALADFFCTDTDDLLKRYFYPESHFNNLQRLPFPDLRRVPRLGNIACGQPITAEENIEGYDDVPAYVKADFTLVCRGDSMTGARIYDGDIVCIRQCDSVNSGEIAAVLVDGEEATLKRVRLLENGIVLWPENPAYQPMIFTGADAQRVRIIGKATHFISVVR